MLRVTLALLFVATCALAVEDDLVCRYGAEHLLPKPITDKPGRKYARDRFVDVQHLKLDVTPDFAKRTVAGTATLAFKPIARPLSKLELDAIGLTIEEVTAQGAAVAEHGLTDEKLVVAFKEAIASDTMVTLTIHYHAQ